MGRSGSPRAWPADVDASNWNRENLAWAAGFFDGEGCIYLTPDGYCVQITAFQNDPELLHRLQTILGAGEIYKQRTGYSWMLSRKLAVYAVLVALYGWFSERRKGQVRDLINKLM